MSELRRTLAERLEDILVDVIERGELDAFSNYLLRCIIFDLEIRIQHAQRRGVCVRNGEGKHKFLNDID